LPTVEPPWQPDLAVPSTAIDTPHTLTGALIGADTVFPEPAEVFPVFVPPALPPEPVCALCATTEPPWQPDWAEPSTATAMPQMSTGRLSDSRAWFPEATEVSPRLVGGGVVFA
jgi:hypothetical protein